MDRTLEMSSDALTNVGKHVMLNIAMPCAHNQRNTNEPVFGFAQMTLCLTTVFTIFRLLFDKTSFQMVRQTGCRYVNFRLSEHFQEISHAILYFVKRILKKLSELIKQKYVRHDLQSLVLTVLDIFVCNYSLTVGCSVRENYFKTCFIYRSASTIKPI